MQILRRTWPLAAAGMIAAASVLLWLMGRNPICTCGRVEVWHGAIDAGNSQHLLDWYSPSHVIHGFLFYLATSLLLRSTPVGLRFLVALTVEIGWELLENSPIIIERYRAATMAIGYYGDSIVNSLSDVGCMAAGFWLARRLPWPATLTLGIAFELTTLFVIRDDLTLNILMLLWPIDAIRHWQAAGGAL